MAILHSLLYANKLKTGPTIYCCVVLTTVCVKVVEVCIQLPTVRESEVKCIVNKCSEFGAVFEQTVCIQCTYML